MPSWAFLLGDMGISGGTNVIFEHSLRLARSDILITLVTENSASEEQIAWHPIAQELKSLPIQLRTYREVAGDRFDLAIATWWRTFYDLWKVDASRYVYFVQSIESRFYEKQERVVRATVDATYDLPLGFVTEAKWIKDYLATVHRHDAKIAPNGVNKSIFKPDGKDVVPRRKGKLRVLVEGPLEVPFKNVARAIALCRRANVDEVWLLTTSDCEKPSGVDRVFSRVPIENTAEIYRSCDVIAKLSYVEGMPGPPLEMFHCGGTSVVYDVTGHDEYIFHGRNGLVARTDDEERVVQYLRDLKRCPELLQGLKRGALETAARWIDCDESSRRFAQAAEEAACLCQVSREKIATYSRRCWHVYEAAEREKRQRNQTKPASAAPLVSYSTAIRPDVARGVLAYMGYQYADIDIYDPRALDDSIVRAIVDEHAALLLSRSWRLSRWCRWLGLKARRLITRRLGQLGEIQYAEPVPSTEIDRRDFPLLASEIRSIRTSNSWELTGPLRAFDRVARRFVEHTKLKRWTDGEDQAEPAIVEAPRDHPLDKDEALIRLQSHMIRERDELVRKQAEMVDERDALIQKQIQMVEERDALIQKQIQMVEERDALIQKQDALIQKQRDVKDGVQMTPQPGP